MRSAGFEPEDYEDDFIEVWPENWPAVDLFISMGTQWRIGMGGATGMDYGALYPQLDRLTDTPEQYDDLFSDIRWMERAALATMNQK